MSYVKAAAALVAVIFVAVGITLFVQMDALVKAAIETVGPRMTLTSVSVASVHVSPFSGTGRIHRLEIGNPRGFQSASAFKLKDIRVSLVPKSLTTEKMIIRELIVEGPEITYEITPSGNNLQVIQKNIESFAPASRPEAKSSSKAAKGEEKKIEIDLFVLKEAKVHVRSHVFGNQVLDVPLPAITLKDIGTGPEGATPKEAASKIIGAIKQEVVESVANSGVLKNVNQSLMSARYTLQKSLKGFLSR